MFEITESVLEAALRRARLTRPDQGAILFGIRGGSPTQPNASELAARQGVEAGGVDYLRARCSIGFWSPGKGISLYPGSTVPGQRLVKAGLAKGGQGVNQLCIGLHRGYRKGTHKASSPSAHRALRMERNLPVMRTADDLDFDADDRLDYSAAFDNIHCGWVKDAATPGYSSAGCQVIVGGANPEVGPWKDFATRIYSLAQIEFDYFLFNVGELARTAAAADPVSLPLALRYGSEGDEVETLQRVLTARGFSTAGTDGAFGYQTLSAVMQFQRQVMGARVPDGIAGEQTLAALGLPPGVLDGTPRAPSTQPDGPDNDKAGVVDVPPQAAAIPIYAIKTEDSDGGKWRHHYADFSFPTDMRVYAGYGVKYESYFGLCQSVKRFNDIGASRYDAGTYAPIHGIWSQLILPTATAESGLWFERLNTYDRAAFTFGFFQAAAHYPEANFILLFKDMLKRPEASLWFPELLLRATPTGSRLFWLKNGEEIDLEVSERRSPTNSEPNLKRFMAYLNADKTKVDDQELSVAARLLGWTRNEHGCRALQVQHAIAGIQSRLRQFRKTLTGRTIDQCLMAADINYQGRAGGSSILAALHSASPYAELCKLGDPKFQDRVTTVSAEIGYLMKKPEFRSLRFDPGAPDLFS